MDIVAYTDGSASVAGNMKGFSGFGTYFPNLFGEKKAFSLGFENGKTGEMEVLALLYAIRQVPKKSVHSIKLTVYSDSEYVVKTFTENRIGKWRSNNWANTSGEVKNKALWIKVWNELQVRGFLVLKMIHIKSHQVDREKDLEKKKELMSNPHIVGNLMADKLADYKRHKTRLLDTGCLKFN